METKTIQLEENGLNIQDGRSMIFRIIDNQIMNYKMQFQSEWERNHNISPVTKNEKIAKLESTKLALKELFNSGDKESQLGLFLNIEVKLQQSKNVKTTEPQLLAS